MGNATFEPVIDYLETALEPVFLRLNDFFNKTRPTITKFSNIVTTALDMVERFVIKPALSANSATEILFSMYQNAVATITDKIKGKVEQVTTLLTSKLLSLDDLFMISKYINGFKDMMEAARFIAGLKPYLVKAQSTVRRRLRRTCENLGRGLVARAG